ncbi:MAG: metallophosphoesterase [Leptospirales bacterium]
MKINVASDLHLETYEWFPKFSPRKASHMFSGLFSCDLLILAGDIVGNPRWLSEWLALCPVPVVYILGNHEYYGKHLEGTVSAFRHALTDLLHVHFLNRESVVVNKVRFVGATLWSDFDGENPLVMEECQDKVSDFRQVEGITVAKVLDLFYKERDWIDSELSVPFVGPTVVVTHYAPSPQSSSVFHGSLLGGAFVTDLEDIILKHQPTLWIHGHTHDNCDYTVGRTRVLSNQGGYGWEEAHKGSRPLTVEIQPA